MCLPCASKRNKIWSFVQNRMTGYPIKFDHNEVQQLRRKFRKISGNKDVIGKNNFRQNMGILGLQSVEGFSDRLFNSFDIDKDGKISFEDFLEYMEVLKCGSEKNKAKISFKLIDIKNKDSVSIQQFKQFLTDYFRSWTSITNSMITPEIKERTDQYVNYIFNKVQKDSKKNTIDFRYYAQKMYTDKDFIDAFEFITEGVANMFISDQLKGNDSVLLLKVLTKVRILATAVDQKKQDPFTSKFSYMDKMMRTSTFRPLDSEIHQQSTQRPIIQKQAYPLKAGMQDSSKQFFKKKKNNKTKDVSNTFTTNYKSDWKNNDTRQHFNKFEEESLRSQSKTENHKCTNCYKVIVLEKKIEYLTAKLQELTEQTKTMYDRLYNKYVTNATQSNHKKQTVENIHHQAQLSKENMIFFGDDNWNLVLNMMIGIQMAVRSVRGYQQMIYQEPADFNLKYYFQLIPRRFGGDNNFSRICSFTDYAPNTFNHIRRIFNIDNEQYINSIGPGKLMASLMMGEVSSLTSLTSQGKSGSFFYYSADGKYMLKTIHYREYRYLRTILQNYYHYIKGNPETLITKFFGLHKLIQKNDTGDQIGRSYFVIMGNVFNTKQKVVQRYDLKGSWYGRQTRDPKPGIAKKDNDFKSDIRDGLNLNPDERDRLMSIIRKDSEFFSTHNIIDYSLLIGIIRHEPESPHQMLEESELNSPEAIGLGIQHRDTKLYQSQNKGQQYIFGIIDILTEYNSRKAMEYYFKRVVYGSGISAVPPDDYSERFISFMENSVFQSAKKK